MDEKEYQDQIELLNKSLDEHKVSSAQKEKEVVDLKAQLEAVMKSAPKAEDLKALQEKAKKADESDKTIAGLKAQLTITELKFKYPDVDISLLKPGSPEEMEAEAKKLDAMVQSAVLKRGAVAPAPKPKAEASPWDGVPGMGAPKTLTDDERDKVNKELVEAMGKGDAKGVLDACFKSNPQASARLLAGRA